MVGFRFKLHRIDLNNIIPHKFFLLLLFFLKERKIIFLSPETILYITLYTLNFSNAYFVS